MTDDEEFIPLSPEKRTRSQEMWREVARRLGLDES